MKNFAAMNEIYREFFPEPLPARTTVQSPLRWGAEASWKLDYNNLDRLTPEEIAQKRREFDAVKETIKNKPGRA